MAAPVQPSYEIGSIRQMIGETHARVEMLGDDIKEIKDDLKEGEDKVWRELRAIKHDDNNRQQIHVGQRDLADRRMGEIERRIGEVETTMKTAVALISDVQRPVNQLVELKSRIWWLAGIIAAVVAFGWLLAQPVYEIIVHKAMGVP